MLWTNPVVKLRIVQQQVREFASLLHQVQARHALSLALEFLGRDAQKFT